MARWNHIARASGAVRPNARYCSQEGHIFAAVDTILEAAGPRLPKMAVPFEALIRALSASAGRLIGLFDSQRCGQRGLCFGQFNPRAPGYNSSSRHPLERGPEQVECGQLVGSSSAEIRTICRSDSEGPSVERAPEHSRCFVQRAVIPLTERPATAAPNSTVGQSRDMICRHLLTGVGSTLFSFSRQQRHNAENQACHVMLLMKELTTNKLVVAKAWTPRSFFRLLAKRTLTRK